MTPWRERALKLGFQSSISLPINLSGKTIGAYTLYSQEIDFFNESEIKLLEELAYDISFALEFIENESKRIQMEEALLLSKNYLDKIINTVASPIFVKDSNHKFTLVNDALCTLLGLSANDLIGNTGYESFPEDQLEIFIAKDKEVFATGKENINEEIVNTGGNEVKTVVTKKTLYTDSNGHKYLVGTTNDITERKKYENEIALKNGELQKLNATKDKFFSIIAHDLRSPFNSIVGFSELLIDQIGQKNYNGIDNYAQIIKKSSGQAIKLLMNLMQWSRLQTGRMEIIPEYFEMVCLINEVTQLIFETSQEKEIILKKILPDTATVYADKNMISTVLRNLFSNAVKFSHPGGTVTITVIEQENDLTISVNDIGVGIEKTRINKLFLLNESVSTIGTRNEKGTGLGLILCKEFVDKNEGKIWIESEVGKGSTFHFTLPRREKSHANNIIQNETLIPAVEIWINKLKILIVEDDETSERLLAIQINHISKTVFEAVTGVEAVDICRKNPDIDLILMDIQLPEMDGYEATRQIREFNKDVIIIALTAYGFDGDRGKALKAGCNDYDVKPVSKVQLIKMIQRYFSFKIGSRD